MSFRLVCGSFIGDDCPVALSETRHAPCGLQVRLVEAREYIMAEISLELSVDILLPIDLVNERVKTDAVFPILVQEGNLNLVSLPDF